MGLKEISLASSLFHRATMKGALLTWILYFLNAFLAVAVMGNMKAEYQVTVYTQNVTFAGTKNDVYITLVGKRGTSKHQKLERNNFFFHRGDESTFTVTCSADLGQLLQIHLEKLGQKDKWLPAKVEVRSPHGKLYTFPVYHWLTKNKKHFFREGTALLDFQETDRQMFRMRKKELEKRRNVYRWSVYHKGMPHCIQAVSLISLPPDDRYPFTRDLEFSFTAAAALAKLGLEALSKFTNKWRSMWDIEKLYKNHVTSTSDYVMKHWREDAFFGYQFLNGVNPMMIQRCETLPSKFPVPLDMILSKSRLTLRSEMKRGNIFLCDYNILDGVETKTINGRKQFLTAPLVLLHKNEYNQMMPIAIQLKQKPGKYNPIFFPTDSEYDWLLAKTYVRSSEFNLHELNFHLLRTHLLAEVYAIALQRNLPRVHPVYKLLIRHTRYTLQINFLARSNLISKIGVVTQFTASGGKGMLTLMDRSVSCLTYRSLCIPDDIADRGLEDVPNFYYRDDGLKLWNIIHRFVYGILSFYYENDWMVQNDSELQNWIQDIFENGFLSRHETGIPQKFTTVAELVKFVTMVIFTCSAQHAAVNSGQYDFYGWMPNAPSTMQEPPPTHKGRANEASFLFTLPDVQTTVNIIATVWLLSMEAADARHLHEFVEEHFTEDFPNHKVKVFQRELKRLSKDIQKRNRGLELPYNFLDPKLVESSIAI